MQGGRPLLQVGRSSGWSHQSCESREDIELAPELSLSVRRAHSRAFSPVFVKPTVGQIVQSSRARPYPRETPRIEQIHYGVLRYCH